MRHNEDLEANSIIDNSFSYRVCISIPYQHYLLCTSGCTIEKLFDALYTLSEKFDIAFIDYENVSFLTYDFHITLNEFKIKYNPNFDFSILGKVFSNKIKQAAINAAVENWDINNVVEINHTPNIPSYSCLRNHIASNLTELMGLDPSLIFGNISSNKKFVLYFTTTAISNLINKYNVSVKEIDEMITQLNRKYITAIVKRDNTTNLYDNIFQRWEYVNNVFANNGFNLSNIASHSFLVYESKAYALNDLYSVMGKEGIARHNCIEIITREQYDDDNYKQYRIVVYNKDFILNARNVVDYLLSNFPMDKPEISQPSYISTYIPIPGFENSEYTENYRQAVGI